MVVHGCYRCFDHRQVGTHRNLFCDIIGLVNFVRYQLVIIH